MSGYGDYNVQQEPWTPASFDKFDFSPADRELVENLDRIETDKIDGAINRLAKVAVYGSSIDAKIALCGFLGHDSTNVYFVHDVLNVENNGRQLNEQQTSILLQSREYRDAGDSARFIAGCALLDCHPPESSDIFTNSGKKLDPNYDQRVATEWQQSSQLHLIDNSG